MRKLLVKVILITGIVLICWACMEIHPILPRENTIPTQGSKSDTCQPLSIDKNIVGTWHFESTFTINQQTTTGIVTFNADGTITDPDSLFSNMYESEPILSKTYDPIYTIPDDPGTYFFVMLNAKRNKTGAYFTVVSNECNKIFLRLFYSGQNLIHIILTR